MREREKKLSGFERLFRLTNILVASFVGIKGVEALQGLSWHNNEVAAAHSPAIKTGAQLSEELVIQPEQNHAEFNQTLDLLIQRLQELQEVLKGDVDAFENKEEAELSKFIVRLVELKRFGPHDYRVVETLTALLDFLTNKQQTAEGAAKTTDLSAITFAIATVTYCLAVTTFFQAEKKRKPSVSLK